MEIETVPADPENTADSASEETTTADPQAGEETAEPTEGASEEKPEGDSEGESDEGGKDKEPEREFDEFVFADEEPQPPAPKDSAAWARMRKREQELQRRAEEAERKLQALERPATVPDPGPEPTLADCDYDEDVLKSRLREHLAATERQKAYNAEQAKKAEVVEREKKTIEQNYIVKRTALAARVKDYDVAEKEVASKLGADAQDILMKIADEPARLVYMLGRRPEMLDTLAKETDRDRFVAKLKTLEGKIVEKKKGTPTTLRPEDRVNGSANPGPAGSTLEQARARAAKSGDYTEVNRIRREQRRAEEAKQSGRK